MPVQTKLCGLSTPEAVDAAIAGGASHIGLMFFPPSPRAISFDQAAALAARIPPHISRVGVFVEPCNALLDRAIAAANLDVVQLHRCPAGRAAAIRQHTKLEAWAAIGVKTKADLLAAAAYRDAVDRLLYDAKPPANAAVPGGQGLRFDWTLLAGFDHPLPWILSGGLDATNVKSAITATGASFVDVSSGIETATGIKDVDKITAFLKAANP
jgi:phosphoribosylanthranilate isomerase